MARVFRASSLAMDDAKSAWSPPLKVVQEQRMEV